MFQKIRKNLKKDPIKVGQLYNAIHPELDFDEAVKQGMASLQNALDNRIVHTCPEILKPEQGNNK